MSDKNSPSSMRLYAKVAQKLATCINNGDYKVGERLPSERELVKTFGVSRPTIREAVIALEVDGLVEVKTGSGVFVKAVNPEGGSPKRSDVGMIELLEARKALESEAAAIAASRITDEQIEKLRSFVTEMKNENDRDVTMAEEADRKFHMGIAEATQNTAIYSAIELFWDMRALSLQTQHFLRRTRAAGISPIVDQHTLILSALERRDSNAAKHAMNAHLTAVIKSVLEATEIEAIEKTREEIRKKREFYLDDALLK